MDEKQLERAKRIAESIYGDYVTKEEVVKLFALLQEAVKQAKDTLAGICDTAMKTCIRQVADVESQLKGLKDDIKQVGKDTRDSIKNYYTSLKAEIESVRKSIPEIPPPVDLTEIENQIAVLMAHEDPVITGIIVRNLLERLEGDERLTAAAIRDLPDFTKKQVLQHLPATHALYALVDVDVQGIQIGQSIKWDGVRWFPYTPAGGTTTPVYGEAPVDSGNQIDFTLAHAPTVGTLRVYRGGAYQQNGVDYTLAGSTITLAIALASGEVLLVDYEY